MTNTTFPEIETILSSIFLFFTIHSSMLCGSLGRFQIVGGSCVSTIKIKNSSNIKNILHIENLVITIHFYSNGSDYSISFVVCCVFELKFLTVR